MPILKVYYCQKMMESNIRISLIQTNIKNILLIVIAINWYVLMISLISLLRILSKDAVYNFISCMIEESKYCSQVMKKHFNREGLRRH